MATLSRSLLLTLLWLVLGAAPAFAAPAGRLVDTAWLARSLGRADLVLLDASPTPLFRKQHIAGAIGADVYAAGPLELTPAQAERRLRSWGLDADKTVVLYDQGGSFTATRIFFELLVRGFPEERLHILDGGLAKWLAEGRAVTAEPTPAPVPGTFNVSSDDQHRARFDEFFAATGDTAGSAVIDALDAAWHYGETAFFDRAGHVPHARLWPSQDLFNADKTFKSPAELRRMLDHLGVKPQQKVYTYCGGGVAASAPWFALRYLAGYPEVKLYVESQLEWLSDARGLPLWTYAEPNLVREPAWLKGWGSAMLRANGVSRVSVVDVRPTVEYELGHVPFALNIPAERFGSQGAASEGLGAMLGRAGVDRAHEAVIVSDGGVNPRAALAYLALWQAGQRQVSILAASPDRWAQLGYEIATEPTTVGPRKSPTDRAVPETTYAPVPRTGVAVAATPAGTAASPRVYVASGARLPERRPGDGTVVHLPYTSLLLPDGSPKPAYELWQAISKAGVPRYAEVVVYADELGEAAVNHFLFRLMGYRDVKVWQPR